jgi:hypothetical protein
MLTVSEGAKFFFGLYIPHYTWNPILSLFLALLKKEALKKFSLVLSL